MMLTKGFIVWLFIVGVRDCPLCRSLPGKTDRVMALFLPHLATLVGLSFEGPLATAVG
jgi:hypothetical protein